MNTQIRKAESRDLDAVNALLRQVLKVHHEGRPDLFRAEGKKYTDEELLSIFADPASPVFVYERDGEVCGYAFCQLHDQDSGSLQPLRTLYLDDLCVDEHHRRHHIGEALFLYVKEYARKAGCHNLTLHAWACNPSAEAFYRRLGLLPQYTSYECLL